MIVIILYIKQVANGTYRHKHKQSYQGFIILIFCVEYLPRVWIYQQTGYHLFIMWVILMNWDLCRDIKR